MPTSGVDLLTKTAAQMIKRAFRLINVVPATQNVPAADELDAIGVLNTMLQEWATDGVTPWRKQSATITPVQGQVEYNIVQRPLDIIEIRWTYNGNEIPMYELEHDEYFELPQKTNEGTPTQFYYRRNVLDGTLFVWPAPHAITTQLFDLTYDRRPQIVTASTEEVDVPQEWFEVVEYNLAARLADEYGAKGEVVNRVIQRAENLYSKIQMFDRQGAVYFIPDDAA